MDVQYDGIILGTGHNSLILQAYLGAAGFKVLSVDRRCVAGGGLTTEQNPRQPGFRHNTHSFYHRAIDQMPWYRDLDLARHGAVYLEPELNVALLLQDDRSLTWWTDFERTAASFAEFDSNDAKALRRWRDDFLPIVSQILVPESQTPPLPTARRRALLEKSAEGRLLLSVSRLTPLQFVQREFSNPVIQAGLLFFNGLREVDLRCPGFGHHIPALLASPGKAQMCVGGSASLAQALVRAVEAYGGEVRLDTPLARLVIERERVIGVETSDGERLRGRHFIVSGLNPQQTFLELIDEAWLPTEWRRRAQMFKYNVLGPLFGLNVALREPPIYQATAANEKLERAFMVILGLEHVDQFADIIRHHEQGSMPSPVMWGSCPTLFDASQAPTGRHTAFMWEKLPYRLHGDARHWDKEKNLHGRLLMEKWMCYAPNLEAAVIDTFTRSALDTERSLPNMRDGDLLVGAFGGGQVGFDRPFPGAGHYRTCLDGLYLCGSCCHPGGNITGLPGYNSAQVILADMGVVQDWMPASIEDRLARV